MWMITGILK